MSLLRLPRFKSICNSGLKNGVNNKNVVCYAGSELKYKLNFVIWESLTMRKIVTVAAPALLLLFFLTSCSAKVDPTVKYKENYASYKKVLRQWTRSKKVYEISFDTILLVTATYRSNAFMETYLAEKIRAEALPAKDAERLLENNEQKQKTTTSFFMCFYTPKRKWNRLHKSDPSWRLWLIDANGNKVAPMQIKKLPRVSVATTKWYPYLDKWSRYYEVIFPREDDEGKRLELEKGKITFMIAGVYGSTEMVWDIP